MFASEIQKRRVQSHSYSPWRWHLDEVLLMDHSKACLMTEVDTTLEQQILDLKKR